MWKDTLRLSFGHALIVGAAPETAELGSFIHRHNPTIDIISNGLFDTAAPNFAAYYPNVTEEDLKPKDADFAYPVFRALSEVIVHKRFNPVDFSMNGVLKKST